MVELQTVFENYKQDWGKQFQPQSRNLAPFRPVTQYKSFFGFSHFRIILEYLTWLQEKLYFRVFRFLDFFNQGKH